MPPPDVGPLPAEVWDACHRAPDEMTNFNVTGVVYDPALGCIAEMTDPDGHRHYGTDQAGPA